MSSTVFCLRAFVLGLLAASVAWASPVLADDDDESTPKFTIGSKAPALDIEHWMNDGEGKFDHTTALKSDKVYVVEFWATWCPPCIASMPHLSETQLKYADKGVQIISVSDEDLETVEAFLEKEVPKKDVKYAELTKNYCLTVDPDGSVYNDYFRAAGQSGIPFAFIVGKQGFVEWMGHPMDMDKPLAEVIEGKWDRDAFAVKMKEEQAQEAAMLKVLQKIGKKMQSIQAKIEEGEAEEGLKMLDELIADEEFAAAKTRLEEMREQIVIMYVGGAEGVKGLKALVEKNKDNPELLYQVASTLLEKHTEEPLDADMFAAATEAAEMSVKADPENGAALDTLAHYLHANSDLDRAIEIQEQAVKHADGQEAEVEAFLKQLKAEKAKAGK